MGMFRDKINAVQSNISTAREKRKARISFFNDVLEDERVKARERASFAQATMLRTKAKKQAQFEAMPRIERAKSRLKRAGNFLRASRGVIQKVDASFTKAGKRFDKTAKRKAGKRFDKTAKRMDGVGSQDSAPLAGSLGKSIFK